MDNSPTFVDTAFDGLVTELMAKNNKAKFPFAVAYEREDPEDGSPSYFIWRAYIERQGRKDVDTIGEGSTPTEAIEQALVRYRREFGLVH